MRSQLRKWNKIIKIILLASHKHSCPSPSRKSVPISNQSYFLHLVLLVLYELSLHHLLWSHINQWSAFHLAAVLNQVTRTLCKCLKSLMDTCMHTHTHTQYEYISPELLAQRFVRQIHYLLLYCPQRKDDVYIIKGWQNYIVSFILPLDWQTLKHLLTGPLYKQFAKP